ncbi:MAG: nucleoside triphosphate pyrophosphohydrolase [Bacillati bacterium ANGP1]|uniref:Nucleoside triphosphate pyrophosphohydrolase n=1 Tax=Candidatus Segetimicrobium genomatis TaxID=2569760 RepID=A0A537JUW3_9BACT|nr:MAG: nucleoside triphosphate pyrophosphohydrolase [Terrabacteria group bacterium ANGP1]
MPDKPRRDDPRRGGRPAFDDLVAIMARLRGPGGCPWDREQTHATLRPYLLEETYETLEAIDAGSPGWLRLELGDLLLQVVFHAQMAGEAGTFTIDDVIAGLVEKLVRRHPHVFGSRQVSGSGEVLANWETIKERERAEGLHGPEERAKSAGGSALDGLPRTLPALALAQRLQERAAGAGFTWPDLGAAAAKVREELAELEAAAADGHGARTAEELGDLLFTIANLPRYLGLDGEQALRDACAKFRERFARLEQRARAEGRPLREYSADELLALWRAAR